MPIYVYRCNCGLQFERLTSRDAEPPACPECGGATRKIPARVSLSSRASSAPPKDTVAPPWQAMAGNPEKIRREVDFRHRLAAKHADASPYGTAGAGAAADSSGESGSSPTSG
jgi:putative FmdB family regulatory protein